MGTRSRIGVMHGSNCKSVYCHWDGYPEHNGRILQEYYDSPKANNLVALGDLSSLRPSIGEAHPFSYIGVMEAEDYDKLYGDMCTFYGRDREETGTEFKTDATFEEFFNRVDSSYGEWYYVMQDGVWYCGNTYESSPLYKKLTPLSEVLESVKETV